MAKLLPVDEFDLIIFGGTGDLAMRKLLPALYHRDRDGQITGDSRIIAVGRSALDRGAYLEQAPRGRHAAEARAWLARHRSREELPHGPF